MDDKLKQLKKWIDESENIVFFGGAGVSTESGIPDFRSVDGLYSQKFDYPPETIISRTFYERKPEYFFRFYREKMLPLGFSPNITHQVLARWEREGKLLAVITQNIDNLHQKAGSREVLELHGSILRAYCARCRKSYPEEAINRGSGVPRCSCGGIIRPDIVLYEEALDTWVMNQALQYISRADVLLVGGTSLNVYPAAGLVDYYRGTKLALVNLSETPYDRRANLVIHEKIGEVFAQL